VQYIERIAKALDIAPYRLFYDETNPENSNSSSMSAEQKQKIKTMLVDNVNEICSMIDKRY
jgi:hypothetical protein